VPDTGRPPILTARLRLSPLTIDDADEMVGVLGDPSLYEFIGGGPPALAGLRDRYARLAVGHSADGRETWHNWIVRELGTGRAVGTVQATVTDGGHAAEVAWVIGVPWQGRGLATEAAAAMVGWLAAGGVTEITALIHPAHGASERVARSLGLAVTDRVVDGERVWHGSSRDGPADLEVAGS
jgi:RimJ/RimL family protein N-acetyltransferase